jgi:hypothetical protein
MSPLTTLTAIAAPLLRDNIDTDSIIPSREMRNTGKSGLADGLFAGWRYLGVSRDTKPRDFGGERRTWHKSSGRRQHEVGIEVRNTQDSGALWCSLERFPALVVGRRSRDASRPAHGTRHPDTNA